MRRGLAVCAAAVVLALSACGGDDGEAFAFGEPGQRGEADRTVEVHMLDGRRFEPASLTVEKGQTITFRVMNMDDELHEFDLGDQKFQDEMEKEMQGMPHGRRAQRHLRQGGRDQGAHLDLHQDRDGHLRVPPAGPLRQHEGAGHRLLTPEPHAFSST
ncbi:MAG: cupredoxin domain-containing protein [Actinomycetota bacterium]|nr:cupredoxin domain-containing protein [Actinomycetota bacterium]